MRPEPAIPNADPGTDKLARALIAPIESGMIVGLGTGKASTRAMRAMATRLRDEKLDIDCVCTSVATQQEAVALGLPVIPFEDVEDVDYLFDGASEVDRRLRMLKGSMGAITRQRLVAAVAARAVYCVGEEHFVEHLGSSAMLSVVVMPFGLASIRNALRDMGLVGVLRRNINGEAFFTDGGSVVFDMRLPERDPVELAQELDRVVGVVDHGIFLIECDELLVECKGGEFKRVKREG